MTNSVRSESTAELSSAASVEEEIDVDVVGEQADLADAVVAMSRLKSAGITTAPLYLPWRTSVDRGAGVGQVGERDGLGSDRQRLHPRDQAARIIAIVLADHRDRADS